MKASLPSPDHSDAKRREFLIARVRWKVETVNRKSQIGNCRAPWEGDWRLAIAEERVAMAEERLREVEERMKKAECGF